MVTVVTVRGCGDAHLSLAHLRRCRELENMCHFSPSAGCTWSALVRCELTFVFSLGSSFKTVDEACTRGRARSLVGGLAASDADRFATIPFSFPFQFLAGRELRKRTGTIDVVS
jgi:hypothetical protein